MEPPKILKLKLGPFAMGPRLFGVYADSYKGKNGEQRSSTILGELEAVVDPVKMTVLGFRGKFGGQRLMASSPEDLDALLKAIAGAVR